MGKISMKYKNVAVDENSLTRQNLEVFFTPFSVKSKQEKSIDPKQLGQVNTPDPLAVFMVSLIESRMGPDSRILDPCIGPNTFFRHFTKATSKNTLFGIEIDPSTLNDEAQRFYSIPGRKLQIGSFFDLELDQKFDFIIQNPPYVRQELLMTGANGKEYLRATKALEGLIPSKSNLYLYFLVKSILHLNNGGSMVAVIQDSWLYSEFGNTLKKILQQLGQLESIFHFENKIFPNADVGATVIVFRKEDVSRPTNYYSLRDLKEASSVKTLQSKLKIIKNEDFLSFSFGKRSLLDTSLEIFSELEKVSSSIIQRGVSSIVNQYFLFKTKEFPECIPIVKNVQGVTKYLIKDETDYVLSVSNSGSPKTLKYLKSVERQILSSENGLTSVKRKMVSGGDNWYRVKLKQRGNFIFNYYMRKNIDFLYNPDLLYSSDNFYSLNIKEYSLAYVAILNSSFSRLSILMNARNQGSGLRKIQLYEFKTVKIFDATRLPKKTLDFLTSLGQRLLKKDRYGSDRLEIIREVDGLLLKEYNKCSGTSLTHEMISREIARIIG